MQLSKPIDAFLAHIPQCVVVILRGQYASQLVLPLVEVVHEANWPKGPTISCTASSHPHASRSCQQTFPFFFNVVDVYQILPRRLRPIVPLPPLGSWVPRLGSLAKVCTSFFHHFHQPAVAAVSLANSLAKTLLLASSSPPIKQLLLYDFQLVILAFPVRGFPQNSQALALG